MSQILTDLLSKKDLSYANKIIHENLRLSENDSCLKIMYVSLYCYANFPVRNFHSLTRENEIEPISVFLKDSEANCHEPITEVEWGLFIDLIIEKTPDIICLSVLTPYAVLFRDLIQRIKAVSKTPIVVGGKYPDVQPERCFKYLSPDFVCKGDGEDVLLEVFMRLKNNKNLNGIQGLWWKDEHGNIVDQGMRVLNQDLSQFPFRSVGEPGMYFIDKNKITDNDPELYQEDIWIMAGRGCVYQCSYCVNAVLIPMNKGNGKFVRMRSPDRIIEELEYKASICQKAKNITYIDEVFGVNYNWLVDYHEKYKNSSLNQSFTINLVPKQIKEKNIALLADIGLKFIQTGIQSGVDHVRNDIFNRPGSSEEVYEKTLIMKKYDVMPLCDMILDNPFETSEDLEETIKLLLSLPKPLYLNTFKLQYYPGYPLTELALKEGYLSESDVSEEGCADVLMNRYNYIPTVLSLSRKKYLENCIYILALSMFFKNYLWIQKIGESLASHLCQKRNILLGLMANVIARTKYTLHSRKLAPFLIALDLIQNGKRDIFLKKSWKVVINKFTR